MENINAIGSDCVRWTTSLSPVVISGIIVNSILYSETIHTVSLIVNKDWFRHVSIKNWLVRSLWSAIDYACYMLMNTKG